MFVTTIIAVLWTTGVKQLGLRLPFDTQVLEWAEDSFQHGVDALGTPDESKFFEKAAEHYQELCQRGIHNAALYRNQGNASLLAGDLPGAVLAYRRGLGLDPNDRQIRANLAYARDQVVYSSTDNFARPPSDWWPPWLARPTASFMLWLFVVSYSATWLGLAWVWTHGSENRWLAWLSFAVSILFAGFLIVQVRNSQAEIQHPLVVIARDQTYLHKGNNALYPRAYETPVNRGVEARLLQWRGSWLQIELAGGQIGWVSDESALVDIASAPLSRRG